MSAFLLALSAHMLLKNAPEVLKPHFRLLLSRCIAGLTVSM